MKTKIMKGVLGGLVFATLMGGCKKENNNGYMAVKMTDAPGDYLHVYVDIKKVEIHYSNANGNNNSSGWVSLPTNAGIYDLIALQNNVTAALVNNTQLSSGHVEQMRLLLGTNNTVMIKDSTLHGLAIPSSYTSGVKINIDGQIPVNNGTVTITLDYDASASINKNGTGQYIMNPVIKVKSIQ